MIISSFILTGIITAPKLTQPVIPPCQHRHSLPERHRSQISMPQCSGWGGQQSIYRDILALTPWWSPTRLAAQLWRTLQGSVRLPAPVQPCTSPGCVPQGTEGGQCPVVWHLKACSSRPASALHVGTPCAPARAVLGEAWSCSSHQAWPQASPVGLAVTGSLANASEK